MKAPEWFDRARTDLSDVAWCCAHYPTTCKAHGFALTEHAAWRNAWSHWWAAHR